MSDTMGAVVCERVGSDGYAVFREFPVPGDLAPHEVLIETRNMSLNFPDPLQIKGLYQVRPPLPFVLGMELSGVVTKVGDRVRRFRPGDRVVSLGQGALAEQVKVPETLCYPLPDEVDFEQGCTIPLAAGTALYGLKYRGELASGEIVAVTGASGGTGLAAVQVAKALGAKVIAICSTEEKCGLAKQVGANHAINYRAEDLSTRIKELTDGAGLNVAYDTVGGDLFDVLSRRMAWEGRLLSIGYASGRIPELPVNLALVKGYSLIGVHWAAALDQQPGLAASIVAEVMEFLLKGRFVPVIDSVMKLEDSVAGIDKMVNQQVKGKILISAA